MPPPPPAPNIYQFPDLPSSVRACQVPALLKNDGRLIPHHVDKAINSSPSILPPGRVDNFVSISSSSNQNVITKSYYEFFDKFLGEQTLPPFHEILPPPKIPPSSNLEQPTWFMRVIKKILRTRIKTPSKSPVIFEITSEARISNTNLLKDVNYSIDELLRRYPNIELGYGREFLPPSMLKPLLQYRTIWKFIESFFTTGFNASFCTIDYSQCIEDNNKVLKKDNHQSAMQHIDTLHKNIKQEVEYGYQFPFDPVIINLIPNSVVAPYGIATQTTFNAFLETVPKHRTTHDLSIDQSPNDSFKKRLIREELPTIIYGFYLIRFLHHIHSLRLHGLHNKIIMTKTDMKSAYRRATLSVKVATMCITKVDYYASLILLIAFGCTNGQYNYPDIINKPITDLTNDLLNYSELDETDAFSPHVDKLGDPVFLPDSEPFGQALPLDVHVPFSPNGKSDDFIDDIMSAGYHDEHWKRLARASLLSL